MRGLARTHSEDDGSEEILSASFTAIKGEGRRGGGVRWGWDRLAQGACQPNGGSVGKAQRLPFGDPTTLTETSLELDAELDLADCCVCGTTHDDEPHELILYYWDLPKFEWQATFPLP